MTASGVFFTLRSILNDNHYHNYFNKVRSCAPISESRMIREIFNKCIFLIIMVTFLALVSWNSLGELEYKIVRKDITTDEKPLQREDRSRQFSSVLHEKVKEFLTRDSWWDSKLCSGKKNAPFLDHISDLVPLKNFNKDVFPHENYYQNIYMLENNCETSLPFHTMCGIESAARKNPNATIFLLTIVPFLLDKSLIIRNLLKLLPNIIIAQADFDQLLKDTKIDKYRSQEHWTKRTDFLKSHVSDAIRVALIWKAGGTYLDNDIISVKELPSFDKFVLYEITRKKPGINPAILRLVKDHEYLSDVMGFMSTSYNGNVWESLGPATSKAGIRKYCNLTSLNPGTQCRDIYILPANSFCPVDWFQTSIFTEPNSTVNLTEFVKDSFGIHLFHHRWPKEINEYKEGTLYGKISKEYCPYSLHAYHNI